MIIWIITATTVGRFQLGSVQFNGLALTKGLQQTGGVWDAVVPV